MSRRSLRTSRAPASIVAAIGVSLALVAWGIGEFIRSA
jgi:hypothetical protein